MKHRGPDDEGVYLDGNVGLGYVRLAIIDLSSAGHQPMVDQSGRYIMVFNGEIFNYLEIKEELIAKGYSFHSKTDAEVLLNAYIEWGDSCFHRFNGMWALAIYDRKKKKIFFIRDRFGVKPFYYCVDENRFIFASEISPILSILSTKCKANEKTIYEYLVFNRTDIGEETFFYGIKKLLHGCCLTIPVSEKTNAFMKIKKWYDLKASLKAPFKSPADFKEMFVSSVKLRLRSDVPVGVCLSGGLDSSSIVSVLLKDLQKKDLNTFSSIYGEGIKGDESVFINEFRNEPLKMHFTNPSAISLLKDLQMFIKAHGEPVPTTSPYAQFKVMELAKSNVVVTLDGQGADEILAGYHYFFGVFFKEMLLKGQILKLTSELYSYIHFHRSLFALKSFAFFLLPQLIRERVHENQRGFIDRDFINRNRCSTKIIYDLYGVKNLQDALLAHFEYKLEHLLKWEDRNSMFFSLEARVPFLDYRLVESTLSLPSRMVIDRGINKNILRESMKGILPEKIRIRRDKIGFLTPQHDWFRRMEYRNIFKDILFSNLKNRGLVELQPSLKLFKDHIEGKKDHSREIWKLIHLELWFQRFIDSRIHD